MAVPVTARAVFQAHIDGLTATGLADLPVPISAAWSFDDAAGDFDIVDFPIGATTLQRPTKATMLVLIPPPTNVTPFVLKGAAGDTGVAYSPNCASILSLAVTPLLIQLTAAVSGVRLLWL